MRQTDVFRTILITGAGGGLGSAIARAYAGPGVTLALVGRNSPRLDQVAQECMSLGAAVFTACLDVRETDVLSEWIRDFDRRHPIDLVIANAGVASTLSTSKPAESWNDVRRVFDTNVYGALATVYPVMEAMRSRGRGQIALMSSLGAYVGMPISPAYNASKAAIKIWGEGLRGLLAKQGVGVTVIMPGFVKSGMSDAYPGPTPFMLAPARAAAIIKQRLARNPARISFPLPLTLAMRFLSLLPPDLSLALQRLFRFG